MSDEIQVTTGLKVTPAVGTLINRPATTSKYDMAGTRAYQNVQTIGTTQEAIAVGADIATLGWASFKNLDDTNFVELGLYISSVFYKWCTLLPGEEAQLPLSSGVTYYAQADTAPVELEVVIAER